MKAKNTNIIETAEVAAISADDQLNQDFKNAVLIVSLLVNAFVLIGWVTLQVTTYYDAQVAAFLFAR